MSGLGRECCALLLRHLHLTLFMRVDWALELVSALGYVPPPLGVDPKRDGLSSLF